MLKKLQRLSAFILIFAFVLTAFSPATFAAATISVDVNGKAISLGTAKPYLSGSTLMLPLKEVSEKLGANVAWDSKNKNFTILRGDNVSIIKQGSNKVYNNGRAFKLSSASVVKGSSTYVSQDFIQAVFGYQSSYDSKTSKLSIKIKALPIYFSDSFRIEYLDNGCKLVTDGESFRLLLVPQGKEAPKGVKADKIINIPIKKVMAASTTQVGPLIKLGVLDSLKAVTTPGDKWVTPAAKKMVTEGKAKYVGGDGMGQPDYEQVKAISPDMVFVYTGTYGQQSIIEKMDEMGINFAVNNEYMESHYLGRMEWIKFMGAFYDKELEAEKILNDAVKEIDAVTAKVAGLKEPKIVWGSSSKGNVSVPNAGSYVAKWIDMAGGDYVFKNVGVGASGSSPLSMEEFYAKSKDADILIYSTTINYMQTPTIEGIVKDNPLFANIKAVKNGNVYVYSADWWETIPETDRFVKDIAAVFHPEAYKGYKAAKLVKLPKK